jgi:predicted phage terminase large subunit-like protein
MELTGLTETEQDELLLLLESVEREEYLSEQERARSNERLHMQADFTAFVKAAWPILEPGNKLSWSWHYDLIAEYLTLAADKKVKRLIINIPPRTLKSILVTVMFPVWVWTRTPQASFACASYSAALSTEHSVKRRTLVESDWFKRLWGDRLWLAKDQNEKTKFKNNFQAQMIATSVGGTATGLGGNFLLVDDGMKPDEVASEAIITSTHSWWDNTWRSRLNSPADDVMILVEQRTGELDLTGHCLEGDKTLVSRNEQPEWTHLCIPLEADEEVVDKATLTYKHVFPISKRLVERRLGDVLQPDRFPPAVVSAWKVYRITWSTQYQQRPTPLEGNMIKRADVRYYGGTDPVTGENDPELPATFDLVLTSTDAAFKDTKTADFVCVGTVGVKGPNRYILEVVTKHLDLSATEKEILRQRSKHGATISLIEDKANGPAIIKNLRRKVPGIKAIEPQGGKISRMYASCGEWQTGNWYVDRNAAWCDPFVEHITKFPGIKNDDDVDMMTQAAVHLQRNSQLHGLTEYLKSQAEEMAKRKEKRFQQPKPSTLAEAVETVEHIAPVEVPDEINKLAQPTMAKPATSDKSLRCENCGSTLMQRIPNGIRCGQCGAQRMKNQLNAPTPGQVRK